MNFTIHITTTMKNKYYRVKKKKKNLLNNKSIKENKLYQ